MTLVQLADLDTFEHALRSHGRLMLFKHSPICPVSSEARKGWLKFLDEHPDVPCFEVDVVGQRPVSRALAELVGVAHQSPQALLVEDGRGSWHASHWDITAASLRVAWAGVAPA